MAQMIEMLRTLSTSTTPKVHQSIPISVPPVPVAAEGRQRHINLGNANIETQTKTHHGSTINDSRGILPSPSIINRNINGQTRPQIGQSAAEFGQTNWNSSFGSMGGRIPKVELSHFEGNNPRLWIKKCEKYFQLYSIPNEQKIDIASLYLGDRADIWYQGWQAQTRSSDWGKFSEELCRRFGELTIEDVVEEFNKLKQKNSVRIPGKI
ncbi:conserved hypothetical protein [Ricinus communis]|uniref:Retrotransposon gag domain-containing protein n=1 Tax=Ricinus communis TaxID=3988 RepID=B9RCE3_RICCO|nr:conserved hypothetical protein [Ricinus communis]